MAWLLVCVVLVCFPLDAWGAEPWKVKRRNRRALVLKRLHWMLARRPMSTYAFRKLLSMHRYRTDTLIRLYRKKQKLHPRRITHRIVLARLYVQARKFKAAKPLFLMALKKYPRSLKLRWYTAECFLRLGQTQAALARFRQLYPSIRRRRQRRLALRKMLTLSLQTKNDKVYVFTFKKVRALWWKRDDRLWLSRLFYQHKHLKAGEEQLRRAIRSSWGRHKLALMLELTRQQVKFRQFREALVTVGRAQRYGRRQSWVGWELMPMKIAIHRGLGSLSAFLRRLRQRWKGTKDVKKLYLLARQFDRLGETVLARELFHRILKLDPREKFARLWLFEDLMKKKQCVLAEKQLEQLAVRGYSHVTLYMKLGESCLTLSKRPMIARWTTAWPRIYGRFCSMDSSDFKLTRAHHLPILRRNQARQSRTKFLYRADGTVREGRRSWRDSYRNARLQRMLRWRKSLTRNWRRSHRRARRRRGEWRSELYFVYLIGKYDKEIKSQRTVCSKRGWRKASLVKWRSWSAISKPEQRVNYRVAIRVLQRSMHYFPKHWDHLYKIERWFTRAGAWVQQAQALRLLVKATGPNVEQVKAVEQLLIGMGKRMDYVELLRRLMRDKKLSVSKAYALAQYLQKPQFLTPRNSEATSDFVARKKGWLTKIRPLLCGMIQRTLKRQPKGKLNPASTKLRKLRSKQKLACPTPSSKPSKR